VIYHIIELGWRYWYRLKGWWCPRHPWPPAWARIHAPGYWYQVDPSEELRILEDVKEDLRRQLSNIEKRIEELRKSIEEKK